ncbi:MAG: hypothetical protein NVSMB17_09170 [Candidatus Dormibacteria bacterium]
MKICESCINRRILTVEEAPMGVNPDNRRIDAAGAPFYLFCNYFYSFPSANMRLNCSHHTPDPAVPAPITH